MQEQYSINIQEKQTNKENEIKLWEISSFRKNFAENEIGFNVKKPFFEIGVKKINVMYTSQSKKG